MDFDYTDRPQSKLIPYPPVQISTKERMLPKPGVCVSHSDLEIHQRVCVSERTSACVCVTHSCKPVKPCHPRWLTCTGLLGVNIPRPMCVRACVCVCVCTRICTCMCGATTCCYHILLRTGTLMKLLALSVAVALPFVKSKL